jgi:hypothetical protein
MTTTTSYGNWTLVERYSVSVEDGVAAALGDFADEYDVDAIARDYRAAINAVLPEGVSLNGNEFYGPYYGSDCDFTDYPTDEHGCLDIKALVESIDFWEIAARHDITA